MLRCLFTDLNSYFASVEQQERPELRGRPVAVVPLMAETTCCIAASLEAKAAGVRTGTAVWEARRLCPGIVFVEARHALYVRYHHRVLAAAETVLPVHAVHSIDEFSCRLLGDERAPENARALARRMKEAIRRELGECVRASVGVGPSRFIAKVASDMHKPDGLVVITPEELPQRLFSLELRDLPGIGARTEARLRSRSVTTVEGLASLSERQCHGLWGSVVGRWFHQWLHAGDPDEAPTMRRSIGHQHVLEPALRSDHGGRAVAVRLLHKAAARARSLGYWARRLTLAVRCIDAPFWNRRACFHETQDTLSLVQMMVRMWPARPAGTPLLVAVTLDDLVHRAGATMPLFDEDRRRQRLAEAMDRVNRRYGHDSICLGTSHTVRHAAPTRIAFGHIPDLTLPETSHTEDEARTRDGRPPPRRSRDRGA